MKKISLETSASISEKLIGAENIPEAEMQIKATKDVRVIFTYPEPPNNVMEVTIIRPDEPDNKYLMQPGDSFHFKHAFKVDITRGITPSHPFPIRLDYLNDTYKLNKTKNNKLLLTK